MTSPIRAIAVFCGASPGRNASFCQAAESLGQHLAKNNIKLIYGGAGIGLMGALADSCMRHGGEVIGVMPTFLKRKEIVHPGVTNMEYTDCLMSRKQRIMEIADAYIALPGGLGTLDELFEVWTHLQLDRIHTPIGLLNTDGYFDSLLQFVQQTVDKGFVGQSILDCISCDPDCERLLTALAQTHPPKATLDEKIKWATA